MMEYSDRFIAVFIFTIKVLLIPGNDFTAREKVWLILSNLQTNKNGYGGLRWWKVDDLT